MRAVPFKHADNEVRQRWNAHGESLRQDDAHIALELGHTKAFSGFLFTRRHRINTGAHDFGTIRCDM